MRSRGEKIANKKNIDTLIVSPYFAAVNCSVSFDTQVLAIASFTAFLLPVTIEGGHIVVLVFPFLKFPLLPHFIAIQRDSSIFVN